VTHFDVLRAVVELWISGDGDGRLVVHAQGGGRGLGRAQLGQ